MGAYFSESFEKRKSVFGLHRRVRIVYEPILRSAQDDPKNEEKRESISEVFFEGPNTKICEKMVRKGLQKGEFISGVSPLGRPWRTFGVQSRFFTKKVKPKRSKNVPKGLKVTPKRVKKP